jgi:hypothetical protein
VPLDLLAAEKKAVFLAVLVPEIVAVLAVAVRELYAPADLARRRGDGRDAAVDL